MSRIHSGMKYRLVEGPISYRALAMVGGYQLHAIIMFPAFRNEVKATMLREIG